MSDEWRKENSRKQEEERKRRGEQEAKERRDRDRAEQREREKKATRRMQKWSNESGQSLEKNKPPGGCMVVVLFLITVTASMGYCIVKLV